MLCKLAWGNVRRAGRDYLVYLLTLTLGVTVFYAFNTVSMQVDIAGIDEEGLAQVMGSMLGDLTYFLAGVMAFLMVYANNFIMKRRKKEFGLYQVLGMGRGRVATIMALETVIVSVVAFVAGIVLGVGLSQLMTFFTASLFKTQIANFHFFFSVHAFNLTLACMLVMFVLTLLLNLRAVRRTKLIELMGAERRNESIKTRNPWIAIAIFAVGVVLVGVAYYRLLRDGFPLTATDSKLQEAMNQFGITTAMVTVGTFALFWGLSGMLIKLLQSLRGVYWRGLNMFTVRQLAAKVNTVCFSMGVIAMLLFLAITSVACGMSIANVMNETWSAITLLTCLRRMSITRPIRSTTTKSTSIRLKPIAWCWPIQRSICTPHGTAIHGTAIVSIPITLQTVLRASRRTTTTRPARRSISPMLPVSMCRSIRI